MIVDTPSAALTASPPRPEARAHEVGFENDWVVSVDRGARRIPGWAAMLLAVVVLCGAMYGGVALYNAAPAPPAGYLGLVIDRLVQDLCIVGPLLAVALVMIYAVERRARWEPVSWPVSSSVLGASGGLLAYVLAIALAAVLGGVGLGAGSAGAARWIGPGVGALLILFQAGCEESFFRAWLQPVLAARWGAWVGLAATSLLFALAHGLLRHLTALAFLNDTLASLAFGLLALRTGALYAPVAAHWGWNWIEQSVLGLSPNPGVDPLGSLFDLDLRGPAWLSGGGDEMNGSICASVALFALIAFALSVRPRAA